MLQDVHRGKEIARGDNGILQSNARLHPKACIAFFFLRQTTLTTLCMVTILYTAAFSLHLNPIPVAVSITSPTRILGNAADHQGVTLQQAGFPIAILTKMALSFQAEFRSRRPRSGG